jgi:LmbE family N-acetylglucosaminyl deacetylase
MSKYLFIEAHVDDVSLCAGGMLSRVIDYGHDATVLCLSNEYNGISLTHEWIEAMGVFKPVFLHIKDFKTRNFDRCRQQILDLFITFNGYDYVITHSANDYHQDHKVVGEESLRAFKHTNLITYTGDWNQRNYKKNYFFELEKRHVETKITALSKFKSQLNKTVIHPDYTWANVLNNGVICGTKYAEAFEIINMVA